MEQAAGQHVSEVSDTEIEGEHLTIKGGVVCFGGRQFSTPELERPPAVITQLLEDADADVAGVCGEPDGGRVDREGKGRGSLKGSFC